jgi:preprotein translocase subunit SecE
MTESLNREQKRLLRKQGELGADDQPVARRRQPGQQRPSEERTSPTQFVREVRQELRKVAWPTRSETINFGLVVLFTIVVLTTLIAGLDWVFGRFIITLFKA